MNLSKYTDYSFRILIYLGNNDQLCKIEEMSKHLKISQNHIKKIVHSLAKEGYILSLKGRTGGIMLAKLPQDINLGDVLLFSENFSKIVDCQKDSIHCTYNRDKCIIKNVIEKATNKFIAEFKKYTLKDILDVYKQ